MTVKRMSRAIRFAVRVNMQYNSRDLTPIGTLGVGIEQAQISHQMFLIVACQCRGSWRRVGNIGIEGRAPHLASSVTANGHPNNELTGKSLLRRSLAPFRIR